MENKFNDPKVISTVQTYPVKIREKLAFLRELIFKTAADISLEGDLIETLKWGEPAYITKTKSASTIRLGWKPSQPNQYCLYFNCNTTLVDTFKEMHGPVLKYTGNRALVFDIDEKLPVDAICDCIALALTYHTAKKK